MECNSILPFCIGVASGFFAGLSSSELSLSSDDDDDFLPVAFAGRIFLISAVMSMALSSSLSLSESELDSFLAAAAAAGFDTGVDFTVLGFFSSSLSESSLSLELS